MTAAAGRNGRTLCALRRQPEQATWSSVSRLFITKLARDCDARKAKPRARGKYLFFNQTINQIYIAPHVASESDALTCSSFHVKSRKKNRGKAGHRQKYGDFPELMNMLARSEAI